jgi:hypothetical protein
MSSQAKERKPACCRLCPARNALATIADVLHWEGSLDGLVAEVFRMESVRRGIISEDLRVQERPDEEKR